jgi:hypothetical protein
MHELLDVLPDVCVEGLAVCEDEDASTNFSLVPGLNSNLAATLFTDFRAGGYGGGNLGIRYDADGFTYPGAMQMGWMDD